MKVCYVFLLCCLLATAPSKGLGESTFHTFTTSDGRSLNAAIKDYNASTKKIQIKAKDGKELWTLPTVFSDPDQDYIRQWIAVDQFMSPTKFKIRVDSDEDTPFKNRTEIKHEITLENETDFLLKDLKIEYRAFILKKGYESRKDSNRVGGGQLHIDEIPRQGKVSKKTQIINLATMLENVTEIGNDGTTVVNRYQKKIGEEQLKGFWIKVYGPEIDGNPSIREWCYPSDTSEKFQWLEKTACPPIHRSLEEERVRLHKIINGEKEAELLLESNPQKAIELYLEVYEIRPSWRLEYEIGRAYIEYLKPANVSLGLEWLEKLDNKFLELYTTLSKAYLCSGEYYNVEKAIRYAHKARSHRADSAVAHEQLASAYVHGGQFDKAVKYQKLAIKLHERQKKERPRLPTGTNLERLEATLKLYQNNKIR